MSGTYLSDHNMAVKQLQEAWQRIADLEAALTKLHGIIEAYIPRSIASTEAMLTIRDAMGGDALKWRPTLETETKRYPCGCEATGTSPIPDYCPEHGA